MRQVTEMPFADAARRVSAGLQDVGDGDLIGIEADVVLRKQDSRYANPLRVTAGQS